MNNSCFLRTARIITAFSLLTISSLLSFTAHAEVGVTDTTITLGTSNAQSGAAEALGKGVSTGLKVYFDKINAAGGIEGRTISITQTDDAYEPENAIKNTEKLLKEDKVFALIGYVGTPTVKAVVPSISREKIPFFAPFTGAGFLRAPVLPTVFNLRAGYNDEMETIVAQLVDKKGLKKIALFMQNDSYGQAGEAGLKAALEKRSLSITETGTYERNTVNVAEALGRLKTSAPDAIVMVGAYKACAEFMKEAKAASFAPTFVNISFVGSTALMKASADAGEGTYITQILPNPFTSELQIAKDFRADMTAAGQTDAIDYTSFEGYVQAALFTEGLKKAGKDLTRDGLIAALNGLDVDLGGLKLTFSPTDHQASDIVYLSKIEGGKVVGVENF